MLFVIIICWNLFDSVHVVVEERHKTYYDCTICKVHVCGENATNEHSYMFLHCLREQHQVSTWSHLRSIHKGEYGCKMDNSGGSRGGGGIFDKLFQNSPNLV